jgi:uncharacterized membrane protein YdbT with pleckstrin-like domain
VGYPRRLLTEGEEIVFDLRPHWKVLVLPAFFAVLLVFAGSYGIGAVDGDLKGPLRLAIGALMVVGLFAFSLWPLLQWLTTHFVVTNRRVIMRSGVLSRAGRDIPLFRINDVTFEHTFFERLFQCGTLIVESAGERGQVTLGDIPHVEHVQREIYTLIEADDQRRRTEIDGDPPEPPVRP